MRLRLRSCSGPTFSSSFVSLAAGRTNRKRELSGAIGEPHLSFAEAKMGGVTDARFTQRALRRFIAINRQTCE